MKQVRDSSIQWVSDSWVARLPEPGAQDVVFSLLRVPFDHAVSYRPGARFGPEAVVDALNGLSLYCTDKRVALEHVRLHDLGEVDVVHSLAETYRAVEDAVAAIPPHARPVFVGGDHSITDPIFRGMMRRHPERRLGLVVLDAHFDSRAPVAGKEHSGHWVRTLGDVLDYGRVAQVGINAAIYSDGYMRDAEDRGVLVRTPYDARTRGWRATIEEVVAHVTRDTDAVYVSVDIDCVDKAYAPGTSTLNPAGLTPHEVMDAVFEISRDAPVAGFDLVEVSPPLDPHGHTALVGAHVVLNHLAGAVRRLEGGRA